MNDKLTVNDSVTIRKTKSVCPVCLKQIDAVLDQEKGEIFLRKECPEHGQFCTLLSREAELYKELDGFYFSVMHESKPLKEYELWPTMKCNMECKICCFGENRKFLEKKEPSPEEIERFISKENHSFYIISGGEPTCRRDLAQIIALLKKHNKAVTINTNGLRLADRQYLLELRSAGLDRVNLQFDGFKADAYRVLRGGDFLEKKKKILNNLKESGMQTTINAVIARRVNDDDLMNIIDYGIKNEFVNGINFFTLCYLGDVRSWPLDYYIMPDQIIDMVCKASGNKISRKGVFRFQKLHLAVKSFFRQRYCFYNQVYLLVRRKSDYEPIENFLNLKLAEVWLDKYRKAAVSNRYAAAGFLAMAFCGLFFSKRIFTILKELLVMSFSYFLKTPEYLKGRLFLSLSFSTGCDPYKFDTAIAENCQNEIIAQNVRGEIAYCGKEGLFCLDFERAVMEDSLKKTHGIFSDEE